MPALKRPFRLLSLFLLLSSSWLTSPIQAADPLDLEPLSTQAWTIAHARHLASRAGFDATEATIGTLAALSPAQAVAAFIQQPDAASPFQHSGIFDPGLDPFPPSRPATTRLAAEQGHALGVAVRPSGNRPMQAVVNKFFYWLRASRLETDRVAYWWAQQMLASDYPLRDKMALFWHGHFATNEDKVRDYRKMLQQLQLFRAAGLGDFKQLLLDVARDPAMLVFLDAGVNTKDSPNENFAREIMELFTMGVGHYGERDVQEAARAFTGWNVDGLNFKLVAADHDEDLKTFLGTRGNFDGEDIIDIILKQPAAAEFLASKLYRYFVNEDLSAAGAAQLGALLREEKFHIGNFLTRLLESREFYKPANMGSRIKSPVELVISTYRLMGLNTVPGVPDFNVVTGALGQRLMHPPTVAGWSYGRSWVTPSLLFERGNFVLDALFPDIGFVPPDRYPTYTSEVVNVQDRLREGLSVSQATKPTGIQGDMAASNMLADRNEAFNTRLGSMRGWQMAIQRVKPIARHTAQVSLTSWVRGRGLETPQQVVQQMIERFFVVAPAQTVQQEMIAFLAAELGTDDIIASLSYAEEPLRKLLHQLLSLPEYQLG